MKLTSWKWSGAGFIGKVVLLALSLILIGWGGPAAASGAGPNGINIGFDFNWNHTIPAGYSAAFINNDGSSLTTCLGGAVTSSTQACDFVLSYSVGGTPQASVSSGGVYDSWNGTCDNNPLNSSPLTLYNCFNQNSYGQIFYPSSSGSLNSVVMRMTCLNPAGVPLIGLLAYVYEIAPNGQSLTSTPIEVVPVDLSTCPTATIWTGKTFSSADFASITLPFANTTVQSGHFYGIFFGGPLVPGASLPGTPTVSSISPSSGPVTGNTSVTITGTNFTGATAVTVGGIACTPLTGVTATSITCTTGAGSAGSASVLVTTPNGSNGPNTLYTYVSPPPVATAIPTLSQWALAILVLLLMSVGVYQSRRRPD